MPGSSLVFAQSHLTKVHHFSLLCHFIILTDTYWHIIMASTEICPETTNTSQPRLVVRLIQARELIKSDFDSENDTYAVITCGRQSFTSKINENNASPVWEETFIFTDPSVSWVDGTLDIRLFDMDKWSKNDTLGGVSIPLKTIRCWFRCHGTQWFPVEKRGSMKKATGEVELELRLENVAEILERNYHTLSNAYSVAKSGYSWARQLPVLSFFAPRVENIIEYGIQRVGYDGFSGFDTQLYPLLGKLDEDYIDSRIAQSRRVLGDVTEKIGAQANQAKETVAVLNQVKQYADPVIDIMYKVLPAETVTKIVKEGTNLVISNASVVKDVVVGMRTAEKA